MIWISPRQIGFIGFWIPFGFNKFQNLVVFQLLLEDHLAAAKNSELGCVSHMDAFHREQLHGDNTRILPVSASVFTLTTVPPKTHSSDQPWRAVSMGLGQFTLVLGMFTVSRRTD